jgi:hypothetical protein
VAKYASVGVAVAILMVVGAMAPLAFSSEPVNPGAAGRYLISTADPNGLGGVGSYGAKVIETYDSFVLADVSAGAAQALRAGGFTLGAMSDRTTVGMTSYAFDTSVGEPAVPAELRIDSYPGDGLYIMQFAGPIKEEWLQSVEAIGIEVFGDLPNYAYLVRAESGEITVAKGLACVEWAGIYQPAYKIAPGTAPGLVSVKVLCGPTAQATVEAIFATTTVKDYAYSESSYVHDFLVITDGAGIVSMANLPDAVWMEQYAEGQLWDETSSEITGGIWAANTPYSGFGNFANLAGWDGANIVVAVADTGLGNGVAGTAGHVDYNTNRVVGGKGYGTLTTWADGHGHGQRHTDHPGRRSEERRVGKECDR